MLRKRTLLKSNTVNGNDSNTLLLLHFDSSLTNSAVGGTNVGNPVISDSYGYDTNDYKFGSASFYSNVVVYFIGTTPEDTIRTAMQSNFTFDYWAKIDATSETYPDICLLADTTNQNQAILTVSHYGYVIRTKSTANGGSSYMFNKVIDATIYSVPGWNHYAYVRNGTNLTLYVNGNAVYTLYFNLTIPTTQQHVSFGGYYTGSSWNTTFNRFDEIRISNIARWTANFTPPAAPY